MGSDQGLEKEWHPHSRRREVSEKTAAAFCRGRTDSGSSHLALGLRRSFLKRDVSGHSQHWSSALSSFLLGFWLKLWLTTFVYDL